jgi:hypothetical protein
MMQQWRLLRYSPLFIGTIAHDQFERSSAEDVVMGNKGGVQRLSIERR